MFGKNKMALEQELALREMLDKNKEYISSICEKKDEIVATAQELEESHKQMKMNIHQLKADEERITEHARESLALSATCCHLMDELQKGAKEREEQQKNLLEAIQVQGKLVMDTVEENKHFTTPSKAVSEIPVSLRCTNEGYMNQLDVMSDLGKKMGVLALNAAIEAGRLGDSGKQFVSAAEDIRVSSTLYDSLIQKMRDKIEESNQKIVQMEEDIRHLLSLLKESNMATAGILKKEMELQKQAQAALSSEEMEFITDLKEKNMDLKNFMDEILKVQERNFLQVDDIITEHKTMEDKMDELHQMSEPILNNAKGQLL